MITKRTIASLIALAAPLVGVGSALIFGTHPQMSLFHSGKPAAIQSLASSPAAPSLAGTIVADAPDLATAPASGVPAWATGSAAVTQSGMPGPAPTASAADGTASPPPAAQPMAKTPPRAPSLNHNVRQSTLGGTVCRKGYTRQVRNRIAARHKLHLMQAAGIPASEAGSWQLDHIIPLSLGGSPRDPANMRLQPLAEAKRKDRLELKLHCLVCSRQLPLAEARRQIAGDWLAAYHRWAKVKCHRPHHRRPHPRDSPA
jgi:hypothetical protein